MSEPKQVSREMMDELNSLRHNFKLKKPETIVGLMNDVLEGEHLSEYLASLNNTLKLEQAIIDYVVWNKDIFEAEKPKKWIVKTKINLAFSFLAVYASSFMLVSDKQNATLFDTREEAEKWTNPQTEVVEVEI